MELALKIFSFILSISILVVLHELGHFLPAKWFKTKVEKFYLFFDPYFSLVKKTIGGTEYGIGWLPFGGYVKIAGMVDESMDTEQLKKPAEPWEFRSKPAWQRLIIMMGGVTVNFFLAWIIFSCLSFFNGEKFTDLKKFESGIGVTDSAKKMGFQAGDKIISIDGKPAERLEEASLDILFSHNVTVERNGKTETFTTNEDGIAEVIKQKQEKLFILPRIPTVVDSIGFDTAKKAGLEKGDKIISINGRSTPLYDEFTNELQKYRSKSVSLGIIRNGQNTTLENVPINENGQLGILNKIDLTTKKDYSFLQAIPRGFERTISSLTTQVKQFRIIFNSKIQGYKSVGGPIAIVNMMPVDEAKDGSFSIDWGAFWSFTAMFSVWLAFLNLIPIPGLDGGHVIFTLWEMITRKPVPQKVLESAQMIGVVFLLGLMVLIFGNDIFKLITNKF